MNRLGKASRLGIVSFMLLTTIAWHAEATAAQLTLTWVDAATNELGVSIERSVGTTGAFGEIVTTGPGVTSYVDSSLANATTYCYRVRAFNEAGYSDHSNTACGTTPAVFGLAVLKVGAGSGTVTSVPAGITCGPSCSGTYASGTTVTLTATPAAGSTFSGWSGGGCSGTGTCSVSLSATTTVTATFALQSVALTVGKAGAGSGTVTSSPVGINCGTTCSGSFPAGTSVTLSASPAAGSTFSGWSGGGCSGTGTCSVSLSAPTTITAAFAIQPGTAASLTVGKAGAGSGTVTSSPAGINCGTTCSGSFPAGTSVTLSASPAAGSTFSGWSGGGCSGTGICTVALAAATTVTATFAMQSVVLTVNRAGTGYGTVVSTPSGISCGTTCTWSYPSGTAVTLVATPGSGSSFAGWSGGGCSGTGACIATLSAPTAVRATFNISTSTGFSDNFQRTDSTVLGLGWTEPQGDFFLSNGKLWNSAEKTRHLAVQTSLMMGAGHVTAEFTSMNNYALPAFGLVFGYVNPLNYYAAYRQVGGSSLLKIVRVANGVETGLAQGSSSNLLQGQTFDVAVTFSPSQIVLTAAGQTLTASGVSVTPGNVGLMVMGGGTSHTVDNFVAAP